MSYTKGPWRLSYDCGYFVEPVSRDQIGRICTVHTTCLSDAGAIANTNLIAASPDMLEALKLIQKLNLCDADQINEDHSSPCEGCAVEAAIAKAEGRS